MDKNNFKKKTITIFGYIFLSILFVFALVFSFISSPKAKADTAESRKTVFTFDYDKFAKDLNFVTYAYENIKLFNLKTDGENGKLGDVGITFSKYADYTDLYGNTYNLPLLCDISGYMRCNVQNSNFYDYDLVHFYAYNDGGQIVSFVGYMSNNDIQFIEFLGFNSPLHVFQVVLYRTKLTLDDNEVYTIDLSPVELYYGASTFERVKVYNDYIVLNGGLIAKSSYSDNVYRKYGITIGLYFGAVDSLSLGQAPITIPNSTNFPNEEYYNVFLNAYEQGYADGKAYYDNKIWVDGELDYSATDLWGTYGSWYDTPDDSSSTQPDEPDTGNDTESELKNAESIDFREIENFEIKKGSTVEIKGYYIYANGGDFGKDTNSANRGLRFQGSGCVEFTLQRASKVTFTFIESGPRTFYFGETEHLNTFDQNTYRQYPGSTTLLSVSSGTSEQTFELSSGTYKLCYMNSSQTFLTAVDIEPINGNSGDESGGSDIGSGEENGGSDIGSGEIVVDTGNVPFFKRVGVNVANFFKNIFNKIKRLFGKVGSSINNFFENIPKPFQKIVEAVANVIATSMILSTVFAVIMFLLGIGLLILIIRFIIKLIRGYFYD
ncbi:MAG: hypothetical protein ACI4M6_01340 [Christensenellaceae bacterium]